MVFSCSFSGTAPAVDFESTGFSAGRMVKKDGAVQPEYHVNDYLCSVRVVTDADGEVLELNDYSGFGKRLASSAVTPVAGSANRYRFSGKEEQSFAGVPWQDFGARMYDPDLARWTTPDPLAEKYPGISPYVYCNDNPVNFVDPDGRSTYVKALEDGKYQIEGGNLDDGDLNIYVVTYDDNGEMVIGESIGKTTSITSFYNTDKKSNVKYGWQTNSIIDPNDQSGINFMSNLAEINPTVTEYMVAAQNNAIYDFKVTNGTESTVASIDIYRGMPVGVDENGTIIYTSARDVGNIMAGYVAGNAGIGWPFVRLACDLYQMYSNIKSGAMPKIEGKSTRNAQRVGWQKGYNK